MDRRAFVVAPLGLVVAPTTLRLAIDAETVKLLGHGIPRSPRRPDQARPMIVATAVRTRRVGRYTFDHAIGATTVDCR